MATNKLESLILYIAHKSHDDEYFSATKLNKILFMADFFAFGFWGNPITEASYVHRQYGPVPYELLKAQEHLIASEKAVLEERNIGNYKQKRITPLANPDLSLFTPEQIQLVNNIINECKGLTASLFSDLTHRFRPWLDTKDKEEIPYYTIFVLQDIPASYDDLEWGKNELQRLKAAGHVPNNL